MLAERLVEQAGAHGELAVGHHDLDPLVAQDAEAAAGGVLARIIGGDHEPPDAGLPDRVGARRGPAVVAARLERDVQGGAAQIASLGGADRLDLGVRRAERLVKALPEHLVVAADDRADQRIRADPPRPPSASSIARARWRRSMSVGADMAALEDKGS